MRKSTEDRRGPPRAAFGSQGFMELVRAIVADETGRASQLVATSPALAQERAVIGASREASEAYFFEEIRHYLYANDTALHMAAAAFRWKIAQILVDRGAGCSARNRRGAEPLHYAADSWTQCA